MAVHYKFKNTINYDAIKFDGVYIATSDLKSHIAQQKKLNHSELQIVNEETGQTYKDDESIPKNSNVIVIRVPFANANKRPRLAASHNNHNSSGNHHHNSYNASGSSNSNHNQNNGNVQSGASSSNDYHSTTGASREALELVSTKNMTEEEKIKYIQSQSTKDFDPARYVRGGRGSHRGNRGGGGGHRHFVPHPGYTCRKCGIPGHSIHDCKMGNRSMPKRSSGIPRDFLMKVDSKEKGALMTPSGEYAVPYIDREAYNNPKVEKAPFFEDGTPDDDTPASSSKTATTLAIK